MLGCFTRLAGLGLLVFGLPCLLGAAQGLETEDSKPAARTHPIVRGLNVRLTIGIDPNRLADVLQLLSEKAGIQITINTDAFKSPAVGIEAVEEQQVRLSKMTNVRVGTILHLLLKQVQGTYRVRREYLEITTLAAATRERLFSEEEFSTTLTLPLIDAEFQRIPLEEALRELVDISEFSVILDGRAREKAKTLVTATLTDVPLDTAVRLLADMADLSSVLLDNVIYVTTRENAVRLHSGPDRSPQDLKK